MCHLYSNKDPEIHVSCTCTFSALYDVDLHQIPTRYSTVTSHFPAGLSKPSSAQSLTPAVPVPCSLRLQAVHLRYSRNMASSSQQRETVSPAHYNGAATIRFMKAAIAEQAPLVAVTGGLGYLGSHVVARMLAKGYYVRTIVPQGANVDFLQRLPDASKRLQIIPVRDPAAEDAKSSLLIAFRGVSTVVHAASFSTHGGKIAKSVASKRIVNALKISLDAASAPGNVVINFIYISSEMAVFDPSQHPRRKTVELTENDWYDCSKTSRESTHAFAYAHTVAEMRLWARVGRGGLPFNVCSVIPSFALGPILSRRHIASTPSVSFFNSIANGSLTDVPDVPMSPVDVRDVARAITALAERPEISGRMLLCAESLTSTEFILQAKRDFPEYHWPMLNRRNIFRRSTGRSNPEAVKALKDAEFAGRERRGRKYTFSQRRANNELGLQFRPVHETVRDTITSLARFSILPELPTLIQDK